MRRRHGPKTIKLAGYVGGTRKTFEYTLDFPEYSADDRNSFVPRLWAGQKVDYYLNEIRRIEKTLALEMVKEVTELAKQYGIVTPYTSYLMAEETAKNPVVQFGLRGKTNDDLPDQFRLPRSRRVQGSAPGQNLISGQDAVRAAKQLATLRRRSGKSGG